MRNRGFKVMLLSFLFIIPLMLVTIKPVYAGPNPPPVEGHWMGPAVIADLTFMRAADIQGCSECPDDGVVFYGEANCKGELLPIDLYCDLCIDFTFDDVNEETIPGWSFDPDLFFPPDSECVPDREDIKAIAAQTVIKYEEVTNPPRKKAKVILLFIVPKGN